MQDKQEILDAKGHDSALFYRLINKHRSKSGVHLNELHVGDSIFKFEEEIMEGWREHFGGLATQTQGGQSRGQHDWVHGLPEPLFGRHR